MDELTSDPLKLVRELTEIGIALSSERDHDRLLEMILAQAERITNADGGTLYLSTEDATLEFEIMHTESLGIRMGGTSGKAVPFPPIALYDQSGQPNTKMVAAYAALQQKTVNIADAYQAEEFDFSGTRAFDQQTGYRSQSFLTVPMRNHENELIGVLQLLNARDPDTGEVRAFTLLHQQLVESLTSQAAVTLTNKSLIDSQRELFDSFIQLIADAIDEKSPYTAGHCRRVPILTDWLAEAASKTQIGPLKDFSMSEDERYELNVAAWLHDCGKITTPEFVVDKATKLETIFDRVELVDARFELLKRDAALAALTQKLEAQGGDADFSSHASYKETIGQLGEDQEFIRKVNVGGEFLTEDHLSRIDQIAARTYQYADNDKTPLLSGDEITNLKIGRGTLTDAEREIINNHVVVTIKMLESLPYPKHLRRVPEYAGGHHEKMDGSGYPNQLTQDDMSIPARMMAIADVFEALTAKDRPYKKPMPLSQALTILGRMKQDNHIDAALFDTFVREEVYLRYAEQFLARDQLDEVDLSTIPGYEA